MLESNLILALLQTPKIGRKTVQLILDNCGQPISTVEELVSFISETHLRNPKIPIVTLDDLRIAYNKAEEIIDASEKIGVNVITQNMPEFPNQLKSIPDAPVIIYVKGNQDCLNSKLSVAVVGTREPTNYGKDRARKLAAIFAEKGLVVVSGLAKGCDTAAHEGCLSANGITVAVLAHGLDKVYPSSNRGLAKAIISAGGCLLSEYPPGETARKNYFVERDRLQSGLSAGVVVIETDVKGGTMHTVEFSMKQGRLLGCLVHPPEFSSNPKTFGNRRLISQNKAEPLYSKQDIDSFVDRLYSMIPTLGSTNESSLRNLQKGGNEQTSSSNKEPKQLSMWDKWGSE